MAMFTQDVYKIFIHRLVDKTTGKQRPYTVRVVYEIDGEPIELGTATFPGTEKGNTAMREYVAHWLACKP